MEEDGRELRPLEEDEEEEVPALGEEEDGFPVEHWGSVQKWT